MINQYIGEQIRRYREKLGLKQQDVANALQVSPQAVSKWERGDNAPDVSLLVPLSKLLGITTDALLGYHSKVPDIFDAAVFCSQVFGYAAKAKGLELKEVSIWANGFFYQITEAVLHHDGIPVKYMGDTFLAFFSGPDYKQRAVSAAQQAWRVVADPLVIALNSGKIYLGSIGHEEYSRPDIMGNAVNMTFMLLEKLFSAGESRIGASGAFLPDLHDEYPVTKFGDVVFSGQEKPTAVYEIAPGKPAG